MSGMGEAPFQFLLSIIPLKFIIFGKGSFRSSQYGIR